MPQAEVAVVVRVLLAPLDRRPQRDRVGAENKQRLPGLRLFLLAVEAPPPVVLLWQLGEVEVGASGRYASSGPLTGFSGTASTGGGGGGCTTRDSTLPVLGGSGGSGIVIVRYAIA